MSEIESDTSGPYRQLLIQMAEVNITDGSSVSKSIFAFKKWKLIFLKGRRDETMLVNMTAVQIDVVDLYEGGNVAQNFIFLKRIIYNKNELTWI